MKDTRFFDRKCFLIDFQSFENVMHELFHDSSIEIEKDYPCLSCYSTGNDCCYEEDEIMEKLSNYLGESIIACFPIMDLEQIYFITDKK